LIPVFVEFSEVSDMVAEPPGRLNLAVTLTGGRRPSPVKRG
jgi:hypothetical protein